MRIIGGKYKGRYLVNFKADHIRPTTDRVKESLFNILQGYIEGAQVLDLFAGTGNLGIEAISRGAEKVVFVEKNPKSLQLINENLKALGVTEEYEVLKADVMKFLSSSVQAEYDVIFIDPPFTEKMAHDVMELLCQCTLLKPGGILAIESAKKERMEDRYGSLIRHDKRDYGDKILSLFSFSELS